MKPTHVRNVLFGLVGVWVLAGIVLAILTFTGHLSRARFETIFVIGFVVFAIVAGLLSRVLGELQKPEDPQ